MVDGECKVPCDPVDRKLDIIWADMRKRVPWLTFSLVLGGLGAVLLFFGSNILATQSKLSDQIGALSAKVETQNVEVRQMKESIVEIKKQLRRSNDRTGGS